MRPGKVFVLLNAAAGTLMATPTGAAQVEAEFARHGVAATAALVQPDQLDAAIGAALASDAGVIVAGGGDGTINAIGHALAGTDKALAVLPLGTMNHLAKELEMPLDLPDAVEAIARGQVQPFNIGQVNERVFLSFSAIGLYSEVIKHRDAQRRTLGRGKWPAMALALAKVLHRFPLFAVRLRLGATRIVRLTPMVFVALSEYQREMLGLEQAGCEGREALSVYVAKSRRRLGVAWSLVRAVFGLVNVRRDLEVICVREMELAMRRRSVRVAVDGEVVDMRLPLRYRLWREGLKVVVPPARQRAGIAEAGRAPL